MKVLVTGSSGFIGGYVLEELLARGHTPIAFDRHDKGFRPEGAELFLGDITDDVSVTEASWALRKPLRIRTQQHTLTFWVD
jgi:nucleoside-diphosphate-sugar epimerase